MRKLLAFLVVALCLSLSYAQSNDRFIESPSWVLNRMGQTTESSFKSDRDVLGSDLNRNETGNKDRAANHEPVAQEMTTEVSSGSGSGSSSPKSEGFLHFGIYFTPVINWLSQVNEPYERSGVSFNATPTLMFDMRLFGRFYLGVGAAFNTMGGKLAYPEEGNISHDRTYTFSYVDIPVRIKIQTPNFSNSRGSMFFSAGMHVGFGTRYHFKDEYKGFQIQTPDMGLQSGRFVIEGRMPDDSRLMNVSAVGQMGFNYQISRRLNLVIGVEYHYGMVRPLKKESGNLVGVFPKYNNQQVGLILGIMF